MDAMDEKKNICNECRYHFVEYIGPIKDHKCRRGLHSTVDIVTGESIELGIVDCVRERFLDGECGLDGKYWEPKQRQSSR